MYGIERSWPLRVVCGLRCCHAHVRQGDMWRHSWSAYDLVYLFQRGTVYPYAPSGPQRRDNALELQTRAALSGELSIDFEE